MEGEPGKVQIQVATQYGQTQPQYGQPQPQYSQPQPQYSQPQPQYGQPGQYNQQPAMVQPPPAGYAQPAMQQQQHSTVVVVNQPAATPAYKPPRPWSTGVCACCDDMGICCLVHFCQPCAECQLASDMGECCCLPYCVPGWLVVLRTKLRTQHNIQGSVMNDCCTVYCCYQCVLCQMKREVKLTRGVGAAAF